MPTVFPPQEVIAEFTSPLTRHTRRIEIYEADGTTRWEGERYNRLKEGAISVAYDRDERRTLEVTLDNRDGALTSQPGGFWYDKVIKAFRGVEIRSEATRAALRRDTWEVQVGEFMIDRIANANFPREVKVTGRDYTKKCMGSKFLHATQFDAGQKLEGIIAAIAGSAGVTKRVLPPTGITIDRDFFFDADVTRWEAIKELAESHNYEVYFDATGYLAMREFRDPSEESPLLTIKSGQDGQLASYEKSTSDANIYNSVIVLGESSNTEVANVYATAKNNDPRSPTSIDKLGERTHRYSSAFIEKESQAQELANSLLSVGAAESYELSFETLLMPWLEVGEVLGWDDPEGERTFARFLLTDIDLPLTLGPMSGQGKRMLLVD